MDVQLIFEPTMKVMTLESGDIVRYDPTANSIVITRLNPSGRILFLFDDGEMGNKLHVGPMGVDQFFSIIRLLSAVTGKGFVPARGHSRYAMKVA